jgi:hypothetical protein
MLDHALRYAREGCKVFPCAGKVPATPNGFKDATTDEATIKAWFENLDYNIAMVPGDSGLLVVDVDTNADPSLIHQLPPTYVVRTPSGGFHYYYQTNEKFGNKKLAANIDIRNAAGYVLVPPSPGYVLIDPRTPVPLPEWVAEKLRNGSHKGQVVQFSDFVSHDHLVKLLEKIDPGCGYDEWTRVLAAISSVNPDFDLDVAEVAKSWSMGVYWEGGRPPNAIDDDYDMEAKLATFERTDNTATIGTLVWMARGGEEFDRVISPDKSASTALGISYTAEAWCTRELPEIVQLIGPINTTSRVMVHAGTGVGKTHFAMAVAASLASGTALCHWTVPKPARVLYIDGEMPRSLMKKRIKKMAERIPEGSPLEGRLVFLSHADFQHDTGIELHPLNTQNGQHQIDEWIKWHKPDLVIFDNIQSLVGGDLKETESWRGIQEWARKLPAHIWVHHSNANGSAYGDKSREWQMDTVVYLKEVDDAEEGQLMFDLSFPKHRENDFEKGTVEFYAAGRFTLSPGKWEFVPWEAIVREPLVELLKRRGNLTPGQIADALDISKKTVGRNAKKAWKPYVLSSESGKDTIFGIPKTTPGF